MPGARPQVLPERHDVHACLTKFAEGLEHFFLGLTQPEHDRRFRVDVGAYGLRVAQDEEALFVVRPPSRTVDCRRRTVSTLWSKTSWPPPSTVRIASASPPKSGTSVSTRMSGFTALIDRTVCAKCAAPPSGRSSRSTEVSTTYVRSNSAMACATLVGSSGSTAPCGFPDVTAQNRQPRVHVSPRSMIVAVPPPQHSPTLGQCASSQTVWRSRPRRSVFRCAKFSPPGGRTFSHSGFGAESIASGKP